MSHAFKALRTGRRATHADGFVWPEPGVWVEVEGPLVACHNGLHVCPSLGQILADWMSDELWLVEVDDSTGDRIDLPDKSVVRRARLVRQLMGERAARHFAADCAESVLHIFERERPGDERPRRAIAVARAFADRHASESEWDAARVAAWAAAWAADRAAAWAAARAAAWAAARAAARDAAWAAAGVAAWDDARAAARDAARAAAPAAAGDAAWDAAWAAARDAAWAAQVRRLAFYAALGVAE